MVNSPAPSMCPQGQSCCLKTDSEPSLFSAVLDLPQLHRKPSAQCLLRTLQRLKFKAVSWDCTLNQDGEGKDSPSSSAEEKGPVQVAEEGLPAYITRIIMSSLDWMDEGQREEVWVRIYSRRALVEHAPTIVIITPSLE